MESTNFASADASCAASHAASADVAAPVNTARDPHDFDAYGDRIVLPTFEQVAKSMARALRRQDPWPVLAERATQAAEGRKMAQAEGFAPKARPVEEREAQIRAGQSMAAQEARAARGAAHHQSQGPRTTPSADGSTAASPGAPKKRRNRNRNKPRPGASSGPKPFVPH